jgi:cbb3-type cytochrome c oxidase subunit III
MAQMAFEGPLNAHPARARRANDAPTLPAGGDRGRGQQLYAVHCATCHGSRGEGDGPGATGLLPAPANLAEHDYAPERIALALWNGVAGTAMPAWREHAPEDLAALVEAVRGFGSARVEPSLPGNLLELGQRAYKNNCVQCHGERGDGRGPAGAELPIAPADLTLQRPTLAHALETLRGGIPGTPMAPWTSRLTDAEIIAVAQYARSLYAGPAPGAAR